jgi:hypothetical protein
MPAPAYPDPTPPTIGSPLYGASGNAMCGDTFQDDIQVHYPYGNIDQFVKALPRIWNMVLQIRRPYEELELRISDAIASTTSELDAYATSGDVDAQNYQAIDEILDKASIYVDYCAELADYWDAQSLEYIDSGDVDPQDARGWLLLSLSDELTSPMNVCWQKPPGSEATFNLPLGGWVKFACPNSETIAARGEAFENYRRTLQKAAMQARCAQEALYSLVAYNVNRRNSAGGPIGPVRPRPPGSTLTAPRPRPPGGLGRPGGPGGQAPLPAPPAIPEKGRSIAVTIAVGVGVIAVLGTTYWWLGQRAAQAA